MKPRVALYSLTLLILSIAENRKLKSENSLLKQQTKLTIDMRPHARPLLNANENNEALPQVDSNLLPSETLHYKMQCLLSFLRTGVLQLMNKGESSIKVVLCIKLDMSQQLKKSYQVT
jgi:hypothetical protein